jgi:hypothetical protein
MGGWDQKESWGHWLGCVERIKLAQDRTGVGSSEHGDKPSGSDATVLV